VVVTALDDMDRVDLYITEMFHGGQRRLRTGAERRAGIELLGVKPDASGSGLCNREGALAGRDIAPR
jgi:hypothetical protein